MTEPRFEIFKQKKGITPGCYSKEANLKLLKREFGLKQSTMVEGKVSTEDLKLDQHARGRTCRS